MNTETVTSLAFACTAGRHLPGSRRNGTATGYAAVKRTGQPTRMNTMPSGGGGRNDKSSGVHQG